MYRHLLPLLAVVLFIGCRPARDSSPAPTPASTAPPTAATPAQPTQAVQTRPAASPAPPPQARPTASPASCSYTAARRIAELRDRGIREASALAPSGRQPGVYWTLNDSGNDPLIFAFDLTGRVLAALRVDDAQNDDWEAMQMATAPNGEASLYIGDIGDNRGDRPYISLYRLPEPSLDPRAERPASGRTAPADQFKLVYPDGARDAETLLVHPRSGEILIVSKDYSGRGRVYRVPQPLDVNRRATLERVAQLDLRFLGPVSSAVTDGAVAADASRLVLRTYAAGLEYDLSPAAQLASAWDSLPRAFPLDDGPQGEGISYRPDNRGLVTIAEGSPARVYQLDWHC